MANERKLPAVGEEIHLPGLSAQPLVLAVGTTIALVGLTTWWPILVGGLVIVVLSLGAWIRDARAEYKHLPDHSSHH